MYMNNNISKLNAQGYDPNLVVLFGQESWKALDAERRLNALRQLEAQTARMSGRTPLDVRVMPEKAGSGGMLGYYDHSRRSMFLHPRYLQSGGLNLGDYSAAAAIRTVLHEGRHGFQWISVAGGSDRVPQDTLLEWAVNQCCYFSGSASDDRTMALYFFQPVEMDARRYARETAEGLQRQLEARRGRQDEAFRRSMDMDRRSEEIIRDVGRRGLTLQTLDSAERRARNAFARYNPRVDASGVQIFHEARETLFGNGMQSLSVGYNLPPRYSFAADGLAAGFAPSWPGQYVDFCGVTGGMPGCIGLPGMF